jgi:hypothetical protein
MTNQTGADSFPAMRPRSAASVIESRAGAGAAVAAVLTGVAATGFASPVFALAEASPLEQAIAAISRVAAESRESLGMDRDVVGRVVSGAYIM